MLRLYNDKQYSMLLIVERFKLRNFKENKTNDKFLFSSYYLRTHTNILDKEFK